MRPGDALALLAHSAGWTSRIPVVVIVVTGAVYLWSARRRGKRLIQASRTVSTERRRAWSFVAGLSVMLVTLTGPVERFADDLFWVHMVQHVLVMMVAAPLFVQAAAWTFPLRLLRPGARRRLMAWWRRAPAARRLRALATVLAAPTTAWIMFQTNLLAWHLPAAFDLILRNEMVHHVEHALFLGLGVLFWSQVIDAPHLHSRLRPLQRLAYVGAASVVGWALSVALTLAPSPLYAPYAALTGRPGGLSALADQRIAAGVMLVPGSISFALVAVVSIVRWLTDAEYSQAPAQRPSPRLTARIGEGGG